MCVNFSWLGNFHCDKYYFAAQKALSFSSISETSLRIGAAKTWTGKSFMCRMPSLLKSQPKFIGCLSLRQHALDAVLVPNKQSKTIWLGFVEFRKIECINSTGFFGAQHGQSLRNIIVWSEERFSGRLSWLANVKVMFPSCADKNCTDIKYPLTWSSSLEVNPRRENWKKIRRFGVIKTSLCPT